MRSIHRASCIAQMIKRTQAQQRGYLNRRSGIHCMSQSVMCMLTLPESAVNGKLLPFTENYLLGEPAAGASAVLTVSYWQEPAVPQVMITVTKDLSVGVLATSQLLQIFLLEPNLLPMDSHSSAAPYDHHSVLKNSSDRTAYHHVDILYFETSFTKSTVRKTHALYQH